MAVAPLPGQAQGPDAPEFLTDQLIAYIGNKRRLLGLVDEAVERTGVRGGLFLDAFAGSGVVSRLAKWRGFQVVANDWEPYTEYINGAYIGLNRLPAFEAFGGAQGFYDHLNGLPPLRGYISRHYCPEDDDHPDYQTERMFFTQENGRRLDAMREEVERLREHGQVPEEEYTLGVASLVHATSWCSNTSGVFKGFHRGWGGATQTAWYRIKEPVSLRVPVLHSNSLQNGVMRLDAREAAQQVPCDIAYLDPPYNQHQYGANYHLLNTVALWDKPQIPPRFSPSVRGIKAAIRRDWRRERNSPWCRRNQATRALQELVAALQSRWILVSYSTDGMIPVDEMVKVLGEAGRLSWVSRPYKRYRVSSQRPSPRRHTLEFVLIVEAGAPRDRAAESEILNACQRAKAGASSHSDVPDKEEVYPCN